MTQDRDELYGLHFRGTDRAMPFVHPYRTKGELNEIEQWKLAAPPARDRRRRSSTPTRRRARRPSPRCRARSSGSSGPASTPRRQGGDAFMMRVKVPGGFLTAPQAREIGVAADAFGEGPDGTESRVFG